MLELDAEATPGTADQTPAASPAAQAEQTPGLGFLGGQDWGHLADPTLLFAAFAVAAVLASLACIVARRDQRGEVASDPPAAERPPASVCRCAVGRWPIATSPRAKSAERTASTGG
jgi:hypothetical protein